MFILQLSLREICIESGLLVENWPAGASRKFVGRYGERFYCKVGGGDPHTPRDVPLLLVVVSGASRLENGEIV